MQRITDQVRHLWDHVKGKSSNINANPTTYSNRPARRASLDGLNNLPTELKSHIASLAQPEIRNNLRLLNHEWSAIANYATQAVVLRDVEHLTDVLNKYPMLRDIEAVGHRLEEAKDDVKQERLTDKEAQEIANSAVNVTHLDLGHNRIGDAGAQALATNRTFTRVNLERNAIGNSGAQTLAENDTLIALDLSFNNIKDAGAKALVNSTSLVYLDLRHNPITPEAKEWIRDKAAENEMEVHLSD
ncbi:hypothetical protein F3J20_00335 [Paraburkholderia sp. Cy-641]|uniref:hypothetical protein n=1 Tax=Paraburkholderia sp. Cy-641 TaxID=2608337 RepID=UPI00141FAA22|nr:hypothetical protein [Paraburkholderia sp. Cy-641]NIF75864.1 hypothetical protein [Paraburkholderia sp. Cy-641]